MKEWLYRALRTFGQAALGYLAANLVATLTDLDLSNGTVLKNALLGLFAAAVAAGLAALMNREKKEESESDEQS